MKIVASKDIGHSKAPLLPLEIETNIEHNKEDITSVLLLTDPARADSPKVKFTFPILHGTKESPREIVQWRDKKIIQPVPFLLVRFVC